MDYSIIPGPLGGPFELRFSRPLLEKSHTILNRQIGNILRVVGDGLHGAPLESKAAFLSDPSQVG